MAVSGTNSNRLILPMPDKNQPLLSAVVPTMIPGNWILIPQLNSGNTLPLLLAQTLTATTIPIPKPRCAFCCKICCKADDAAERQEQTGLRLDDPKVFQFLCQRLTLSPQLFMSQNSQELSLCFECTNLYRHLHTIHRIAEDTRKEIENVLVQIQSKVLRSSLIEPRERQSVIAAGQQIEADLAMMLRTEIRRSNKMNGVSSTATAAEGIFTGIDNTVPTAGTELHGRGTQKGLSIEHEVKMDLEDTGFEMEEAEVFPEGMEFLTSTDNSMYGDLSTTDPLEAGHEDSNLHKINLEEYLNLVSGEANTRNSQEKCWRYVQLENGKKKEIWRCDVCADDAHAVTEIRKYKSDLSNHFNIKHKSLPNRYTCFILFCGKRFGSSFLRWQHAIKDHYRTFPFVCKSCQSTTRFADIENYDKHVESAHKHEEHKCRFCSKLYINSTGSLRKHELKEHQDQLPHVCPICKKIYFKETFLISHLATHAPHGPYKCLFCTGTTNSSEALEEHLIRNHFQLRAIEADNSQDTTFPCEKCGKVLTSAKLFSDHAAVHNKNNKNIMKVNQHCEMCPEKSFSTTVFLLNHLFRKHEAVEEKTLSCPKCSKTFVTKYMHNRHLNFHSLEKSKPLACEICEQRFKDGKLLEIHVENHSKKNTSPLRCEICFMIAKNRRQFRNHQIQLHPELFKYSCHQCEMQYPKQAFLDAHLQTHAEQGSFKCTICNTEYLSNKILSDHVMNHTGERMIPCEKCEKQFKSRQILANHMANEHGQEKTFMCTLCDKRYAIKIGLEIHMKTHEPPSPNPPARPFICKVCGKAFTLNGILVKHERQVHQRKFICVCEICGKTLTCKTSFKTHMAMHARKDITPGSQEPPSPNQTTGSFVCDVCGKAFKLKRTLATHGRQVHQRSFTCVCEICGKTLTCKTTLKTHMALHEQKDKQKPRSSSRNRKSKSKKGKSNLGK